MMGMHLLNKLWPRDVCSIMLSEKHLSTTASQICSPRLLHILHTQRGPSHVQKLRFNPDSWYVNMCEWSMQSHSSQPPSTSKDVLQIGLCMNLLLLFMTLIGVSQTEIYIIELDLSSLVCHRLILKSCFSSFAKWSIFSPRCHKGS